MGDLFFCLAFFCLVADRQAPPVYFFNNGPSGAVLAAKRLSSYFIYPFNSLANPVNRRVASRLFIAIPIACVVPIMTTVFLARVSAV